MARGWFGTPRQQRRARTHRINHDAAEFVLDFNSDDAEVDIVRVQI